VADSPWPFPAPTRQMHFLSPDAQLQQLPPPRPGSSPLFPVVKPHSHAHPTVEFTCFCEFHPFAIVVYSPSDIHLQFRGHFGWRLSSRPFGDFSDTVLELLRPTRDLKPFWIKRMLGTHKSVVATADNAASLLRSGRINLAVPHVQTFGRMKELSQPPVPHKTQLQ
jgi:hypothetical protein